MCSFIVVYFHVWLLLCSVMALFVVRKRDITMLRAADAAAAAHLQDAGRLHRYSEEQ